MRVTISAPLCRIALYIVLGTLYIARLRTQETGSDFTSETVAHCNWTKTLTHFYAQLKSGHVQSGPLIFETRKYFILLIV